MGVVITSLLLVDSHVFLCWFGVFDSDFVSINNK